MRPPPPPTQQIVHETLPALADLKRQGLIRAIGITGYPLDIFTYILDRCGARAYAAVLVQLWVRAACWACV
jgi:aryl-alcohol dehydrogenase-like predicted oxidoreductase